MAVYKDKGCGFAPPLQTEGIAGCLFLKF